MSQSSRSPLTSSSVPPSPLTPGFEALSFVVPGNGVSESEPEELEFELSDGSHMTPDPSRKESFQYDPGVIRRMKKSGKYTLNNDVFEQKSRPVSVASIHELADLEGTFSPDPQSQSKESKFNSVHKPVLFLKSCPSPATFLHKRLPPDPESLIGKLSMLDSIVNDIQSASLMDGKCELCGFQHHPTEHCLVLSPDVFDSVDSDTEIHCNPLFRAPAPAEKGSPSLKPKVEKKHKKRRKVFKFNKENRGSSDSD